MSDPSTSAQRLGLVNQHDELEKRCAAPSDLPTKNRLMQAICNNAGYMTAALRAADEEIARLKSEALHYTEIADAQCKMAERAESGLAEMRRMADRLEAAAESVYLPPEPTVEQREELRLAAQDIRAALSRHLTPPEEEK